MADPDYYLGAPIVQPAGTSPAAAAPAAAPSVPIATSSVDPDYLLGAPIVEPAAKPAPPAPAPSPGAAGNTWVPDWVRALSEGGASGMTFGLSDLAGAAGAATGAAMRRDLPHPGSAPSPDSTWGQDFRNRLAEYRADAAQHPYANLIGTLVGAAGLPGLSANTMPAALPAPAAGAAPFAARPLAAANVAQAPGVLPAAAAPGLLARSVGGAAAGAAGGALTDWTGSDDPTKPINALVGAAKDPAAAARNIGGAATAAASSPWETLQRALTSSPALYGMAGGALPGVGAAAAPVMRAVEPYVSAAVPHALGAGAGIGLQHLLGVGGEGGMFAAPIVGERALTPAIAKLWNATAGRMMRNPAALTSMGAGTGAALPAVGQAVTPWWATPGAGSTP